MSIKKEKSLSEREVDRIIGMAWEDRTPFDAIQAQFGLKEQEVITLMRQETKTSSWKRWRKHVQGRKTKHLKKRNFTEGAFKSRMQKEIRYNNMPKQK